MLVDVKLPIVVRFDNVGAIFMADNSSSGVKIHHIDTRYNFVCEHDKDGLIKIAFVQSSINDADMFTENLEKKVL
jgi:hypothetical protein